MRRVALLGFVLSPLVTGCVSHMIAVSNKLQGIEGNAPQYRVENLQAECERIYQVTPMLTLATMLEGPMECGDVASGESVPCDEFDTEEEKQARAQRLQVRKVQEAAARDADAACRAYEENPRDDALRRLAEEAVLRERGAERIGSGALEQ
ncbi:MAG: hypothetical protein AAGL69_03495 [Pseudomonadota bacterium]